MGLWIINYALDAAASSSYLDWFRHVHIPEKLARPGYTWAAHYRSVADARAIGESGTAPGDLLADNLSVAATPCRYTALFGGDDSRVFYNPSPAQIKPTQPPLTRQMMAHRRSPDMVIASLEWAIDGSTGETCVSTAALGDSISRCQYLLWLQFDVAADDQALGAWCCQQLPVIASREVAGLTGGLRDDQLLISKWLAGTGEQRHHLMLHWSPAPPGVSPTRELIASEAPSPHRQWAALLRDSLEQAGLPVPLIRTGVDVGSTPAASA